MKIIASLLIMVNITLAGTIGLPIGQIAIPATSGNCRIEVLDMTTQIVLVDQEYDNSGIFTFQVQNWGRWYNFKIWSETENKYIFEKKICHALARDINSPPIFERPNGVRDLPDDYPNVMKIDIKMMEVIGVFKPQSLDILNFDMCRLQTCTDLKANDWYTIGEWMINVNSLISYPLDLNSPSRFYRYTK